MSKLKSVSKYILASILLLSMASASQPEAKKATHSPAPETLGASELLQRVQARADRLKFGWEKSIFQMLNYEVGGQSVTGLPLIYWTCGDPNSPNRSLVLSSVHGDEITPVYFGFRLIHWLLEKPERCQGRFIVVAPLVNPDGFLRYSRGTRTNQNKVDLNRNFDTPEWAAQARKVWKERYSARRRYFPGEKPGSEPETRFQKWLIGEFRPTKILSIHAPLNILDYDGPTDDRAINFMQTYVDSCEELKKAMRTATPDLRFFAFGNFPGSLGNYAGKQRGIPTITTELPSTNPTRAARYFKMMAKGTETFLKFELKDAPTTSTTHASELGQSSDKKQE